MAKKKTVRKTKTSTAAKTAANPKTTTRTRSSKASTSKTSSNSTIRATAEKQINTVKYGLIDVPVDLKGNPDIAALLADPNHDPPTDDQLRKVKSGLTKRDLDRYRSLLMEKRSEILGDVESLQADARNDAGASISYEHMADTGSDNYEQEFTLGLMASERRLLAEIDDALVRLREGFYGVCLETGNPIGKIRLDAKPWAKYCIDVIREKERRGDV